MRFLPVAHRELLAAAHRRITYRVRWSVALAAAGVAALCFLFISSFTSPARVGIVLFQVVGCGCLLLAGLAGLFLTADAIAAERRDGTLGLLYLTQLGPFDILAGKLVALGANAACAVLAVFPVLSVAWILGGFTGAEVVRLLLAGLNVLFVSLVVGLAVSAWVERQGAAVGGTAAILGALALWPWLILSTRMPGGEWFASLSPLAGIGAARGLAYQAGQYWGSLALGQATGWLFLTLAAIGLKRGWRESGPNPDSATPRRRRRQVLSDSNPFRLRRSAVHALLSHSMVWPKRLAWLGVLIPAGFLALNAVRSSKIDPNFVVGPYVVTAFLVGLILKGIFAWEATAVLGEARRVGALELLLSTPVTDRDISAALRKLLYDTFFLPMLVLYGLDWAAIFGMSGASLSEHGEILMLSLVGALLTFLQCEAMILGGLWWGVREERPTIAFAKNFLLCTGLSVPLMWVCCTGFVVPLVLISWLSAKLRMPLRVLLTEKNLPKYRG